MTIRVLKPNVLIGHATPAVGAVLEVEDAIGHRHIKAGTAAQVFAVEIETAEATPEAETADAPPRPTRRRAAVVEV